MVKADLYRIYVILLIPLRNKSRVLAHMLFRSARFLMLLYSEEHEIDFPCTFKLGHTLPITLSTSELYDLLLISPLLYL